MYTVTHLMHGLSRSMIEMRASLGQGAAECVLERCTHVMREDGTVKPLTAGLREAIGHAVEDMAKDALRCLVAAQKVS